MALARNTIDKLKSNLSKNGYTLISADEYVNSHSNVVVKCTSCSGSLTASYSNLLFRKGSKCIPCRTAEKIKNISDKLDTINQKYGFRTTVSAENVKSIDFDKLEFICSNGHKHKYTILDLLNPRSKYRCRKCYTDTKRYSAIDMVNKTKELRPDIEVLNPYEWVATSKVRDVKCLKHNRVFKCSLHNIWNSKTTCPECRDFGFDVDGEGYLYYAKIKEFYKIGVTGWNPTKRLRDISEDAVLIEAIKFKTGQEALDAETLILENFDYAKLGYNPGVKSGWSELFIYDIFSGTNLFAFRGASWR